MNAGGKLGSTGQHSLLLSESRGVAALSHEPPDGRADVLMVVLKPALQLRRARGAVEVEVWKWKF